MKSTEEKTEIKLLTKRLDQEKERNQVTEPESDKGEEKDDKSLISKIKRMLYDSVIESTIHGMPRIFNSDTMCLKILWTICLLASTITCIVFSLMIIHDYLEFHVVSEISIELEKPMEFRKFRIYKNLNIKMLNYKCNY